MKISGKLRRLLERVVVGLIMIPAASATGWAKNTADTRAAETRLWQLAEEEQAIFEQSAMIFRNIQLEGYLNQVSLRLLQPTATPLPPVTIRVLEDPVLKAFAYPNGVIYMSTGMLVHTQNEDQLAAIIAHEMVHYLQRHALSAFNRRQPSSHLEHMDPFSRTADTDQSGELHSWYQSAERQADEQGLSLMRAAGYQPREMLSVLVHFESLDKQLQNTEPQDILPESAWQTRVEWVHGLIDSQTEKAVETDERAAASHAKQIAPAFLANAKAAVRLGLWNQARESLDAYIKINEHDPLAFFLKGKLFEQGTPGDLATAELAYEKALELNPDFASAHLALGMLGYKSGKHRLARDHFQTGLALAPQSRESAYVRFYLKKCSE